MAGKRCGDREAGQVRIGPPRRAAGAAAAGVEADPVVGFTDDRVDCQTMPIEDHDYAGQSFEDVFTPEQQAALKEAFPTAVCDYSEPGKGFGSAVPWLTYQDDRGNVIYGGVPMGPAPVSVPYGPSAAGAAAVQGDGAAGPVTPATGGATPLTLAVPALLAATVGLLRRHHRLG